MSADPKTLAETALNEFPQDTLIFQGLTSHPELLERLTMVDGVDEINPAELERQSEMFAKIRNTLNVKSLRRAEHESDILQGEALLEAERFLDGEIKKLTNMRDALHANS